MESCGTLTPASVEEAKVSFGIEFGSYLNHVFPYQIPSCYAVDADVRRVCELVPLEKPDGLRHRFVLVHTRNRRAFILFSFRVASRRHLERIAK